jgi:hypothetical protein
MMIFRWMAFTAAHRQHAPKWTLLFAVLLAGCSNQGVRLSPADRDALDRQPVIHVLHYETALPQVKNGAKTAAPAGIRHAAGADPAGLIAQSFSRLIGRKEKLKNLQVESHHLPPPVAKNPTDYRKKYRRGLALELWVDRWSFEPSAQRPDHYTMRLNARARLARIDDGHVLWSTGNCSANGKNTREPNLTNSDLTKGTRLRKAIAAARDECVRQLARDFYSVAARK